MAMAAEQAAPLGATSLPRAALWAGAALLLLAWLVALGAAPLFDIDEGAFGEASREMLASGDWGHTTLNGADRFDKPILVYWLQASSLAVFGVSEFALRLPSALCAWAWALAIGGFVAARFGARTGVAAALLLSTALGPMLIGRAATADALLNLLICLAGFDLWRAIEAQPSGAHAAPLRRAALWIGLGLLAKGPVAVLVPDAAVFVWVLSSGRWAVLRALCSDVLAWAILLGTAVPWYAYALHRHGQAFIDGFVLKHNVGRMAAAMEGHSGGWSYYLLLLPALLLPWSALLAPLLWRARRLWAEPQARYLLGWAAFVLVFFSLSATKLPHYALYGATPLVVLAARQLDVDHWGLRLAVALAALALLAFGPASPELCAEWLRRKPNDPYLAAMLAPGGLPAAPSMLLAQVLMAAVLLLAVLPLRTGALASWQVLRLPLIAAVAALGLLIQTLPWWGAVVQGPVRDLGRLAARESGALVQWRLHQPSVAGYAGRSAPKADPAPGELALVRLDRLSAEERAGLQVLAERSAFALVRRPTAGTATP